MTPDQLFNAGLRNARGGDFYGAVINLRLAASLGEQSAEIYRLLGKAHVHLGELDRAEESFRRALALDSRDEAAAFCLATLRKCRSMRRAVSAAVLVACVASAFLILWFPWQAYRRLDASLAAISASNASRRASPLQSESALPVSPHGVTQPSAAPQRTVATPSSRSTPPMATSPALQTQSRSNPPASRATAATAPSAQARSQAPAMTPASPPKQKTPASPQARAPQAVVEPAAPATVKIPAPRPTPLQTNEATPLFESRYKEAVGAAFKGDLKRALEQLSALAGDEYANQPLAGNVHFWMGRCLYELGRTGEARDHFQRVLERYPNSPKRGEALIDLYRCERKLRTQTGTPQKQRLSSTTDPNAGSTKVKPAAIKPLVPQQALEALDIRVGTIVLVEDIPKSGKLVRLTVDFGDHRRTIIAGLKEERSNPKEIEGKQTLFAVNLEPKKIFGEVSEGMLFDIGYPDGVTPCLAVPERMVPNGVRAG